MLKQPIRELSAYSPTLLKLRTLIVQQLGRLPERLDFFRLTHTYDFRRLASIQPGYVIDTGTHVTPLFTLDGDSVEISEPEEPTSVSQLTLDEAAAVLARELAEVA